MFQLQSKTITHKFTSTSLPIEITRITFSNISKWNLFKQDNKNNQNSQLPIFFSLIKKKNSIKNITKPSRSKEKTPDYKIRKTRVKRRNNVVYQLFENDDRGGLQWKRSNQDDRGERGRELDRVSTE